MKPAIVEIVNNSKKLSIIMLKNGFGMKEFGQYFSKQWINSHWNKWQLFKRACGLSITNSPIKSYKNQIKTEFTERT